MTCHIPNSPHTELSELPSSQPGAAAVKYGLGVEVAAAGHAAGSARSDFDLRFQLRSLTLQEVAARPLLFGVK